MRASLCVIASLFVLVARAEAQSEDDIEAEALATDDRARVHFESGRAYFEEGSYESALTEFQRAYDMSGRTLLLLNIASTQERLGLWTEAAEVIDRYLAEESTSGSDRAILERRMARLRERARSADPPDPVPRPAAPPPEPSSGVPLPAMISYGIGGAGLAVFAVFGILALTEESSVADACGVDRSCGDEDLDPIDAHALIADVGLGVAIVGAAIGTVLLLTGDDEATPTARVTPRIGTRSAMLEAELRF